MADDVAPPAYQEEAAPPPAAFGQVPPEMEMQPIVNNVEQSGEIYKEEQMKDAKNGNENEEPNGGGENNEAPKVIIVQQMVAPPPKVNGYVRSGKPKSDNFRDLFLFKLSDQRVNAFSNGNDANSICCCHLLRAVTIFLAVFLIYHSVNAYFNFIGFEYFYGAYGIINCVINFVCFFGVFFCKSMLILPQIFILFVHIFFILIMGILRIVNEESFDFIFALFDVMSIVFTVWLFWIFKRVWNWAKYFENGGKFEELMFKPP